MSTFGDLADKFYGMVTAPLIQPGYNKADFVFDCYDHALSIKSTERERSVDTPHWR